MDVVPYESVATVPAYPRVLGRKPELAAREKYFEAPRWMIMETAPILVQRPPSKLRRRRTSSIHPYRLDAATKALAYNAPIPGHDILTINPDRDALSKVKHYVDAKALVLEELDNCRTVTDILRLFSICMLYPRTTVAFSSMWDPLIIAFYRTRPVSTDARICGAIRLIIKRLDMVGLRPGHTIYATGIRFAARSRRLDYMRFFLTQYRVLDMKMPRQLFRGIVAKLSINNSRYGWLRNGWWKHSDLMQIMEGFEAADGAEKTAHLGAFLNRRDWIEMNSWLKLLVMAGREDLIWEEWNQWKSSDWRWKNFYHIDNPANRRLICRGDIAFIRALAWAKAYDKAWIALQDARHEATVTSNQLYAFLETSTKSEPWRLNGLSKSSDADELLRVIGIAWTERCITRDIKRKVDGATWWRTE